MSHVLAKDPARPAQAVIEDDKEKDVEALPRVDTEQQDVSRRMDEVDGRNGTSEKFHGLSSGVPSLLSSSCRWVSRYVETSDIRCQLVKFCLGTLTKHSSKRTRHQQ